MGIEPARGPLRNLENARFRVTPTLKCDGRVNFRGIWDHVGIRRRANFLARVRSQVSDRQHRTIDI